MSTSGPRILALLTLAVLGAGHAAAQTVVNIDAKIGFQGVYSGQGAFADPGHDFWNAVTSNAGGSNLTASDGTTTTSLSISFSGTSGIGFGGAPAFATNLLADYYYTHTSASFTIGGLTAGHTYQFYFYSQAGSSGATDRAAIFTLNGNTQSLTGDLAGSFVQGTNYVTFTVTPSGTSLAGSFAVDVGNGGGEAEFNGVQIVESAVPEPSTYAAIAGAVALVGAVGFRRRHAQS